MLAAQALPHSLGLLYEELTAHLGFRRSSDEYKVMAMASYGTPPHLDAFRELVRADGRGGFAVEPVDLAALRAAARAPAGRSPPPTRTSRPRSSGAWRRSCSTSPRWLHARTGDRDLVLAGGVALNCVANSRIWREGPFERALGAARRRRRGHRARGGACTSPTRWATRSRRCPARALGRGWDDDALDARLETAEVAFERPADVADAVAEALADNEVVAWFQGRSEYGPRALGHRSLLADPRHPDNLEKLNDIKGREQFRPVAPMVLAERAPEIFDGGPIPSPYMLFTHGVRPGGRSASPPSCTSTAPRASRPSTAREEPLVARMLERFEARTGVPVVVNTSLNTAGRPMVDDPRDALECFGSAPVDLLAIGPFVVRRAGVARAPERAAEPVAA